MLRNAKYLNLPEEQHQEMAALLLQMLSTGLILSEPGILSN
jgi:hypothetical protein